jgi:GNAT superfamily N-acetyltransferase
MPKTKKPITKSEQKGIDWWKERERKVLDDVARAKRIATAMKLSYRRERNNGASASLSIEKDGARTLIMFGALHPNTAIVAYFRVEKAKQRQGAGTVLMHDLVALADRIPIRLALEASPLVEDKYDDKEWAAAIPKRKLAAWYRRFGFKGPAKKLVREPQ